ncbi:MAG: VOC family protein [Pseudomonadota bacterium]
MNLNQVTVNVTDMDAAIAFYETLGLRLIVHTHERYARFECPQGDATFSLHLSPQPTENGPVIYFECADVDAEIERITALGLAVEQQPKEQPWLWREAYLRDPSGNRICLYHAGPARRFPPWRTSDT